MAEGVIVGGRPDLRTQALHQLVGYAELINATGVSRSTIERAWRGPWDDGEPRLPKPGKIGSRSVWMADEANAWLLTRGNWQCGRVAAMARANPDELAPDQLAPTMRELGARLVADRIGEAVAPDQISLTITRTATNDDLASCRGQFIERLEELCGHFDYERALLLVAAVFPALRERLFETFDPGRLRDPEVLRQFAADACLDDDVWAELQKTTQAERPKAG